MRDIKKAKGVLVLGTSETGNELNGLNYWGLLNLDKTVKPYFSVLGGAGRDYTVYFPIILKNPDLFKDLQILVYINPTYWRESLCNFDNHYFTRYVGLQLAANSKEIFKDKNIYEEFLKPARYGLVTIDSLSYSFNDKLMNAIDDFKSYFYYDLNRLINDNEKISGKRRIFDSMTVQQIDSLKNGINLEYNALESFLASNTPFPAIHQDCTFRYDGLYEFINLCIDYEINATFYLGPYNEVYGRRKNPERLDAYKEVMNNIKLIINSSNMPLIDGSYISQVPGTFLDVQHISQYGAFLSAQQIKEHYETAN